MKLAFLYGPTERSKCQAGKLKMLYAKWNANNSDTEKEAPDHMG